MFLREKQKYLALSNILISVTMLSNSFNNELENDSSHFIDFIGNVFSLKKEEIEDCKKLVLDELTVVSTIQDVDAFFANQGEKDFPKIGQYLYLKCDALLKLKNIYQKFNHNNFNQIYFEYRYLRPYYPDIRFKELVNSSTNGDIDINRTVAICLATGVGCKEDIDAAIYRFKQCAYWGDISSLYYLTYLYEIKGDEKEKRLYSNLCSLSVYLSNGITNIPNVKKNEFDKLTSDTFSLIASIKQDIILSFNLYNIDFSFVEIMLLDKLDYYQKMKCINEYDQKWWKELTNSSSDPNKKLGFNVKGGK